VARIRRIRLSRGAGILLGTALSLLGGCASTSSPLPPDPVTARAQSVLEADQRLAGREIKVSVGHRVAHLSGVVQSTHDVLVAQDDVLSVPGVAAVDAELAIVTGGTPP
jgi:osmotically-inducible protein OsmY